MIHILTQILFPSHELDDLIDLCRSSRLASGKVLRKAHERLGNLMAPLLLDTAHYQCFTVLIMMRAGLPFGLGIADELEQMGYDTAVIFVEDDVIRKKDYSFLMDRQLIIADAVVNSGQSVCRVIDQLKQCDFSTYYQIVTAVMPESAINEPRLSNIDIYSVRISKNQFEGAKVNEVIDGKGPDTGDRLFRTFG